MLARFGFLFGFLAPTRTVLVLGIAALAALGSGTVAALAVATPSAARSSASGVSTGWSTVFRDDFGGGSGSAMDANWRPDVGTSYPGGAADWGTGEVETSTDSSANVHQDGAGHLVITPIRDSGGHWTSARVETTRTDFAAPVGGEVAMTASIRQPNPTSGLGYWPAFWALGDAARPVGATDWPSIGELDVMEDVNALSEVSHTFHCGVWGQPPCNEPDGISSGLLACSGCQTAYHTYTVIVDRRNANAEQVRFYTDDVLQYTVNQNQTDAQTWSNALHHGFFLILDVAIGGSYPDKVCGCASAGATPTSGAAMSVDYVAVSTTGGSGSTAPTTTPPTTKAPATTAPPTTAPSTAPTSTAPTTAAGTTPIQAEGYAAQAGTTTEASADTGGGQDVTSIGNGDWLRFDGVDFGSTARNQFSARVASGAADGVSGLVEVHLDSRSSPAVGSFAIGNTGSWQTWRTVPANMSATTGRHTVYLEFVSGAPSDFVSVNWFRFS